MKPGARRDAIVGPHGGALKLGVAAPPERGKANAAVAALLAGALGIPASRVRVASGAASPDKSLAVDGLDAAQVRARLSAV